MSKDRDEAAMQAYTLLGLGRAKDALQVLGPAIAAAPRDSILHCFVAQAFVMLGRMEEAVSAAQDAVACDPTNSWAYRLLAIGLMALVRKYRGGELADPARKQRAHAAAQAAVRYAASEPEGYILLAEAAAMNRYFEQAVAVADHAVELAPESAEAHNAVAYVAVTMRDWSKAEDAARAALALDPQSAAAQSNLALALDRTGRPREATDVLRDAARVHPARFEHRFTTYVWQRRKQALLLVSGLVLVGLAALVGDTGFFPLLILIWVALGAALSANRRRS